MRKRFSIRRQLLRLAPVVCVMFLGGQEWLHAAGDPVRVVILGSSTAAGANASPSTASWVNTFAAELSVSNPGSQVTNLAVGGFTTFSIMPAGNIPPGTWNQSAYLPQSGHNITAALALAPDLIIINLPTNDCDVLVPVDLQIANYATVVALAAAQNVPVWITTPQPRNSTAASQSLLRAMVQATNEAFAGRSVDFWTGLGDVNGNILPAYNSDGTHLNTAGHAVLVDRILNTVTYDRPVLPFVAMHPRARTVTQNDTTSFSILSFGSEPVTMQWQRNGEDLPGETSPQLLITTASLADSGATFRCIISVGDDHASSNEAALTVHGLTDPASTLIISDDFSDGTLNTDVWTFWNPKNDVTLGFTGAGTADAGLTLQIPAGTNHDIWTNANEAPQILQPFTNQDFEIEVKFASIPATKYQQQGLVVQRDSANLVRFDVVQQGTRAHLFAATFTDGTPMVRLDSTLAGAPPQYLRLKRAGNLWTGSCSADGQTWQAVTAFSFAIVTTAGGIVAGNAGDTPSAAPAFTAQADYFFNTAAPIDPEDGPRAPVIAAPSTGSTGLDVDLELQWHSTGNEQDSVLVSADSASWSTAPIVMTVGSDTPSLHLSDLVRGATYYWKVRCSRDGVWSPWSRAARFSTTPPILVLRASTEDTTAMFAPDTTWADPSSRAPSDWGYGPDESVPVTIRAGSAVTFLTCSLTVHWDPTRLFWKSVDVAGSVCAEAAAYDAIVDTATGVLHFSAAFADTVTLLPHRTLVRFLLGVKKPGRSLVTAEQIQFAAPYNGTLLRSTAVADTLTTSVLLGDVASRGGITVRADGRVDFDDLSAWSLGYWSSAQDTGSGGSHYRRKFDFGPTVDGTPYSMPVPDGKITFEDLMIMALMYGTTGSTPLPKTDHVAAVTLEVMAGAETIEGSTTIAPVLLSGNASDLHGLAIRIPGIARRFISLTPGTLLSSVTPAPLVFERVLGEDIEINIAVIKSTGRAIPMNGELLRLHLTSGGAGAPSLLDARDAQNQSYRLTSQTDGAAAVPSAFALEQNYPNPFNPTTKIQLAVTERQLTTVHVFDLLGRHVGTLLHEIKDPGTYTLTWDASGLPSGMYLCRMTAGGFTATRRMMLVK